MVETRILLDRCDDILCSVHSNMWEGYAIFRPAVEFFWTKRRKRTVRFFFISNYDKISNSTSNFFYTKRNRERANFTLARNTRVKRPSGGLCLSCARVVDNNINTLWRRRLRRKYYSCVARRRRAISFGRSRETRCCHWSAAPG